MPRFNPEELGIFINRANPDQQALCADLYWRPLGSGSGTVTSVDLTAPGEITVGGVPITTSGTITLAWTSQLQNLFFASPDGAPGVPSFRAIVPGDLPGGVGTVTSVDVAVPTELLSAGGPITTSGTITLSWVSQFQNMVFASPDGIAGTPAFRFLVPGDIPALSYVASVNLTAPTEFVVGGVPITSTGTITLAWANESANVIFAGPVSGGAATPTFRSIVAADLGTGTADATKYLRGDLTWQTTPVGSVTSVGLLLPASVFTITVSPVTTSGTLTAVFATQSANTLFAGPTTGVPATPTFRALVAADLPAGTGTVTSVAMTVPSSELAVSGSPITTSGTLGVTWQNQTANKVFAGPTSGGAATPAFRILVASDIPSIANLTDQISQTGHGLAVGDVIRFNGTNYVKAQADSAANAEVAGIVTVVVDADTFFILTTGYITTLSGLVAGSTYFLSPTSAGALTATEPTTDTQVTKPLLIATSTTAGYFMNMRGLVIGSPTQAANTIYAGPTSGGSASPTFRTAVAEDIATGTATSGLIVQSAGAGTKPVWASPPTVLGILSDGEYTTSTAIDFNSVQNSFDVPAAIGTNHTGITGVASTDIVTDNAHGYANGTRVIFSAITGGSGLAINIQYYIITATTNTYQLSLSVGGAAINFTTDITAGTIRSVGSLQFSIPGGSAYTKWMVMFFGLCAINSTNTTRNLGFALVTSANNPVAPGNSGLAFPVGYVSNAASCIYGGGTSDLGTAAIPLQMAIWIPCIALTAGTTYKIVCSARNLFALNTWTNRSLVAIPVI